MSGDSPRSRRIEAMQAEINRQALVDIGKRLAELEEKFVDLECETEELKQFNNEALDTAKRLQDVVDKLISITRSRRNATE